MYFKKRISILSQQVGIIVLYTFFFLPSPLFAFSPLLRISAPSENQIVLGKDITLSFIVGLLTLGPEGHIHVWLDNPIQTASTAAIVTSQFDYILEDVAPGIHTLTLEVVKPDHTSFSPIVKEMVHFTTTLPQNFSLTPSPSPSPFATQIRREIVGGVIGIGIIITGLFILFFTKKL